MPIEPPEGHSCDWGGCHQPADTWRYDNQHGNEWLPVCTKCSRTTWGTHHGERIPRRNITVS